MTYSHRQSNNLVAVIGTPPTYRAKRQGRECLLTRQEIHTYVQGGPVKAVRAIMLGRNLGIIEAYNLLKQAAGR